MSGGCMCGEKTFELEGLTATSPATPASREALDDVLAIADELELMDCHRLAARLREAAALLTAVIRPSTI